MTLSATTIVQVLQVKHWQTTVVCVVAEKMWMNSVEV